MLYASQLSGLPLADMPLVVEAPKLARAEAVATYQPGRVTLRRDQRWRPFEKLCALAHEFTHHLQFRAGQPMGPAMEPQAYTVTAQCMAAYGQDAFATWAYNMAEACKYKRC